MTDYSVINNVNVFVRLSGFIHPISRPVLLESSKRTTSTLDHFLVFSGKRPPLRSDHAIVRTYDHICRILLKQQTEIDVSGSRCLATTLRSSIHRMPLVVQMRRSTCGIVGPRATARNATHTKTLQRNNVYTSPFFWYYIHYLMYIHSVSNDTVSLLSDARFYRVESSSRQQKWTARIGAFEMFYGF